MGRSLGAKRREITDVAREQIVAIYAGMLNGEGEWGEHSKILDAATFGYREVRIERPLRMAFTVDEVRVSTLLEANAIQKLEVDEREDLVAAILAHVPRTRFMDRALFDKALKAAFKREGLKVGGPVTKAIWSAFGEIDEKAEICRDAKGFPEPDVSLRDHELVPMGEDWRTFFEREVKAFVGDAWVDEGHIDHIDSDIGRVGYEINFNRFFYRYTPPRPLKEIDGELKALEAEIAGLLKEIAA
jgi:type I restriction enzyme M protein